MAPTMAPAAAPAAESAPEDMSDDDDSLSASGLTPATITDSCDKPVPTQYEAFVDVSRNAHNHFVVNNIGGWLGAEQCVYSI